jgi:hypothetical protein
MNYELAGKTVEIRFDGGEKVSLAFAEYPAREVRKNGDPQALYYRCAKISSGIYYLTHISEGTLGVYVLNTAENLAARIVTDDALKSSFSFGAIGAEGASGRPAFTNDLDGNTVVWHPGGGAPPFKTLYGGGTASVERTGTRGGEAEYSVSDFAAVKIGGGTYLQNAVVTTPTGAVCVNMLSDFHSVTCVGSVYGVSEADGVKYKSFGGYGRVTDYEEGNVMDLREHNKITAGDIVQYAPPQNFELVGQKFYFVMDDGYDYELNFIGEDELEWNFTGGQPGRAKYLCCKGDDTTYLVSFELGAVPRSNHTWVIDLENWLVTRIAAEVGENPRYPYLITPKYEFGVVRRDGVEVKPYPRHGFTSDVVGNIVQWTYGGDMATVHIYYHTHWYRITYPPEKKGSMAFNEAMAKLPSPDEPAAYIKIKDGMYLLSITEQNMERLLGAAMHVRSNTMCFIQNYKRVYQVGRAFGTATWDEGDQPIHLLFGAYGKLLEPSEQEEYIRNLLTDPNPYMV